MQAALLVPGFGETEETVTPEPVLGFGPAAELMAVAVTDRDRQEAQEVLRRYDRNNDQAVSGEEITSRFVGRPMDFDRNGDKKLTLNELAVRAAKLRVVQSSPAVQPSRNGNNDGRDRGRDGSRSDDRSDDGEQQDPNEGRRSYLTQAPKLPEGLPGWFESRDADGDQQIQMSEYASDWTDELVAEFSGFDANGDGVVTPQECLFAVRNGASASDQGSSSSSRSMTVSSTAGSTTSSGSSSGAPAITVEAVQNVDKSSKNYQYAERMVSRSDTNKDGALTSDEWEKMIIKPVPADADRDGRVTVPEYAAWLDSRSR